MESPPLPPCPPRKGPRCSSESTPWHGARCRDRVQSASTWQAWHSAYRRASKRAPPTPRAPPLRAASAVGQAACSRCAARALLPHTILRRRILHMLLHMLLRTHLWRKVRSGRSGEAMARRRRHRGVSCPRSLQKHRAQALPGSAPRDRRVAWVESGRGDPSRGEACGDSGESLERAG